MANILCILFHNWKYPRRQIRQCSRKGCGLQQKMINGRWFNYTPLNKPVKKFNSRSHELKQYERD